MSPMQKFLRLLDMNNWNGNSAFLRHLHVIRRLFFSIPTAILFLPNMFLFQDLTYDDGRKVNFAEYCMMCILYYAFVFIPINALIRVCQAKRRHMGFKEFLNAPDRLTRKNVVVSPEDSESTIADDFCTDISPEELELIKNQYSPVISDKAEKSHETVSKPTTLSNTKQAGNLPLIDYSKDKQAPGGYIPRKMLSWEHDFEQCNNIFANSNLPVISNLQYITRNINTMILQDPDGSIGRSVQEIFYYEIPKEYQNDYLLLIETLNLALHQQERFAIDLSEIVFTRTADSYREYALPLSCIYYNSEKHIFSYCFSNEIQFEENGLVKFKNTETGSIIYTEDGVLKKATLQKVIDEITYTCQFKNYKSGFDLYDIRGKGEIIYKRTPK